MIGNTNYVIWRDIKKKIFSVEWVTLARTGRMCLGEA